MKKLEPLLFVIGTALFGILLYRFGLKQLVENIRHTGAWILLVFALQLPIYALNTQTWRVILGDERRRFSWFETFRYTVSAFALNYITPLLMLGGEPYRAYVISRRMDASASVSSVVLFRLFHTTAHLLTWGMACGVAFLLLPLTPWLVATLIAIAIIVAGMMAALFYSPQNGIIGRWFDAMQRARFLGPLKRFLINQQSALAKVNTVIVDFYRWRRPALYAGIGLELAARLVAGLEAYIILRSIAVNINPVLSFYIYSAGSLFTNIFFFMPFELGIKEGSLYFILSSLGLAPEFGILIGVVGRIREFLWIFVGLLFLLMQGQRRWISGKLPAHDLALVTAEEAPENSPRQASRPRTIDHLA